MDLKRHIRELPNFPEPRARFRDITSLLQSGKAFQRAVGALIAGGTAVAAAELVELVALGGREWLWDCEVFSLIRYE